MATKMEVLEGLADALPQGIELFFYHISTPSTPCPALFSPPPGQSEEKTFCESHFLAVSLPAKGSAAKELLVFAIEVLVFTTQSLTTIFVSKADSTGYLHLAKTEPDTPSIIKTICTTFLSYLVKQRLDDPRVLLSLFARSQNQYLFPGSIENPGKHILDDRQLIKWWCRTLDPVLRQYEPSGDAFVASLDSDSSSEAFVIVPGCDRFETRAFFPSSTKSEQKPRWSNSYPIDLIVPDVSAPSRCLIPRFPDDPKARFLDDLDSEISDMDRSSTGRWRSVKSLDQFWEMISYRQECSAGRLVGFIWVVFTPSPQKDNFDMSFNNGIPTRSWQSDKTMEQLPTPTQFQTNNLDPILAPLPSNDETLGPVDLKSPPPSSPLLAPTTESSQPPTQKQDTLIQQDIPKTLGSQLNTEAPKPTPAHQSSTSLTLPEPHYNLLQSHLLSSDFSTLPLAAFSTSSWIAKASELADTTTTSWGQRVVGRKQVTAQSNGRESTARTTTTSTVNFLTGLRKKKRKVEHGSEVENGIDAAAAAAAAKHSDQATSSPGVVTLPSDLVRKKQKAS